MRTVAPFLLLALTAVGAFLLFRRRQPSNRMTNPGVETLPDGLTIQRIRTYTDALRSYRVLLDGEEVTQLKNGAAVTLSVPPGDHRVEVEIAFMNAVLDFTMTEQPKYMMVGRGLAAGGNAWTTPVITEVASPSADAL